MIVSNIINEMIDNLTLGVLTSQTRTRISPTISRIEFALQKTCPKISTYNEWFHLGLQGYNYCQCSDRFQFAVTPVIKPYLDPGVAYPLFAVLCLQPIF